MKQLDPKQTDSLSEQVGEKARRKMKALHSDKKSIWFGLGMMGMVGWSVVVPTLLGTALGMWLDETYPQTFSWTLSFLVAGLFVGCLIAWHWVKKEDKEIHNTKEKEDE